MITAAIDCGTNSTRLLIADGQGKTLLRVMRITRLGQNVAVHRRLEPAAMTRTLAVLSEFRRELDRHGVESARMVATSAVRDAQNGDLFLDRASRTVGTPAELLSGDEEGVLSFLGATSELRDQDVPTAVLDIGGGSTELVVRNAHALRAASLQLGCVRITDEHLKSDPPTDRELTDAKDAIEAQLATVEPDFDGTRVGDRIAARLIGLAGTVSTLACLEQRLGQYQRERVHHFVLTRDVVNRWCGVLATETAAARLRHPGMVDGRQDVILGGALILRQAMHRYGFLTCLVSESDILDGLILSIRAPEQVRRSLDELEPLAPPGRIGG